MRKYLILILGIIILILIINGCLFTEDIKIGFSASLTGKHASLGLAVRDGVQMAVDEINDNGGIQGHQVQLLIKDDENNPELARENDQKLIEQGVVTIIGHVTSEMTEVVLPLINREDMLLLGPTISSNQLSGIEDNFISLYPPNRREQEKLGTYSLTELDIQQLSIIYDIGNKAFSSDWADYFSGRFETHGCQITDIIAFDSSEPQLDHFVEMKELIINDPDGILIIAAAIDTALFAQQLRKMDSDIHILSSGWAFGDTLLQKGGPAVEGLVISNSWDQNSRANEYLQFKERFQERYQRLPGFAETYGYETMQLLKEALLLADEKEPLEIKKIILEQDNFSGLQAEISFDQAGDSDRDPYLFQIEGAQYKKVDLP